MFLVSTRITTRTFLIAFVLVSLGLGSVTNASDDDKREEVRPTPDESASWAEYPVTFRLVWFDTYRLLPHSFETMSREVNRIYERAGVNIVWETKKGQGRGIDTDLLSVNVVLLPSNSTDWGLKRTVMGVATHREGLKGSIYVFYPSVLRTMQLDRSMGPLGTPKSMKYLAKAMARVVSHELVHILAPHRPHTVGGLMSSRLTRKYLLAKNVHFDSDSARVVHAEIRARISEALVANAPRTGADEDIEVATSGPLTMPFPEMERRK
jgi:hypothetical protein